MTNKYFIFFCFVFFIGFGSCASLTMGPQQIDFVGSGKDFVCQEAHLKLEGSEFVTGEILFSEDGFSERKLSRHNLSAEEVGLKVNFPEEVFVENKTSVNICVKGKKGNYHGIVLYRMKNKPVRVGIWMNVSFDRDSSLVKISGDAVSLDEGEFSVWTIPLVLLVILGLLVLRLKFRDSGDETCESEFEDY